MIAELIFHWAKRTPEKTAVIHNGNGISYASFAHSIAQARGYCARRGQTGPGLALIVDDNLINFWILALALQSLGFTTFVPREDAADSMESPGLRCVVTTPGFIGLDRLCAARGIPFFCISLDRETALAPGADGIQYPAGGHILTTSGTTGTYKKLLVSAAEETGFLQSIVKATGLTQDSVFNVFRFPPSSGIGYKWAASAWLVGGTTLIEQGDRAYETLFRPDVTHATMYPSLLSAALAGTKAGFRRNDGLQLYIGGGPMTRTLVSRAKDRVTPQLFNVLSSTEAGIIAVTRVDTPEDLRWQQIVPGRRVEVVDDSGAVLTAGQTGRLRVSTEGGPGRYLEDDEATRAAFRDGFFYPGDLGIIRSDGRLALEGRVTEVINRQGIKTPIAPVEHRLSEIFTVDCVCVFSRQDTSGEEELHVVIGAPEPLEHERLISGIGAELGYFSRANIHYVASLPRNPAGKILREAVRAQAFASQPSVVLVKGSKPGRSPASV